MPALAILLLAVAGCSSTTFFYNRLDFLVPWYVDDYVDLDREQDEALAQLLQPFLDWHRREELPLYIGLLDEAEDMLDSDGLSLTELRELTRHMELAGERLQTRSLDWLLPIGEQLSDEQIEEFIVKLEDRQEELEEEYLDRDLEEYREDAYDRLQDNVQDYLGRLDRQQKDTLRGNIAGLERSDQLWLAERQAWIERLRLLLQREPGWQDGVREALATRWSSASPEYRRMYEHNISVIQRAVVEVVNSRSERQDRHLRNKVTGLREDFLALSRDGMPEGGEATAEPVTAP
ncbi:DUF6279 family lipoprotein [Parahaliea aestuarii]|uniref:Lipoprotein n=1 Tax=Parahaliea aestuarii TaxID=1852021 RepID=A0A5C8ZWZ4_9GAMM|nr:DUF6279 family lipoprotein [Parahaliea aestuarii]TXS92284.1 hypothetical protein FVW59_07615 [Parahaliea aestuarii]